MTSEYPLDGSFDVSSSIDLNTTGASIDVSIAMLGEKNEPTSASLHTVDGYVVLNHNWIVADRLRSSRRLVYATVECRTWNPLHAGSFVVSSSTTNATSTTILKSLPIGAVLTIDASTTGDIRTELPLAFEGAFRVSSLDSQVLYNPLAIDPAGGRRKRVMKLLKTSPVVHGIVHWAQFLGLPKKSAKGMVNLRTTEGRAILKL